MIQQLSQKNNEPDWLVNKRLEALKLFQTMPLPNMREEEWRYTDFSDLKFEGINPDGNVLHHKLLKEANGVIFTSMKNALKEYPDLVKKFYMSAVNAENKFLALHFALWDSGYFLYVPENVEVKMPFRSSMFASQSSGLFTHNIIVLENNSKISFLDECFSQFKEHQALHSDVTEIILKDSSKFNLLSLQSWGLNVFNFSTRRFVIDRNANLDYIFGLFGSRFNKTNIDTMLNGEGAQAKVYGVYFGIKKQSINLFTNVYHNSPNTSYEILAKGVLRENSSSIHRGLNKIKVNAHDSNSQLKGRVLILSSDAHANVIPALEIDNNAVQAGHEAAVGEVDENILFYLMSRGLPKSEAERLVVQGFFEPIMNRIPFEKLKQNINILLSERISNVS